jgi:hypothetical protein
MKLGLDVICSSKTYDRLENAGIVQKSHDTKAELNSIILFRTIGDGLARQTLELLKSTRELELSDEKTDALELEELLEDPFCFDVKPHVFAHPYLIARMVFKDELQNYKHYGFNSKIDFARAIATYCITENRVIQSDTKLKSWRNHDYRNQVRLCDHGDLSVIQTNIQSRNNEDIIENPESYGFGINNDWSLFLITVLKYAEALGKKDIPEIKNWRDFAESVRRHNPWNGNTILESAEKYDSRIPRLFSSSLNPNSDPLFITQKKVARFNDYNLEILTIDPTGNISICQGNYMANRTLIYYPSDLVPLLLANYQLFARSTNDMAQILNYFNSP